VAKTSGRKGQGFGSLWHLAIRFLGALVPFGPRQSSERWALDQLSPSERSLFTAMSGPDRRHAIGVAHRALHLAASDRSMPRTQAVMLPPGFAAAALLHDVGKIEARLGTFGRVFATVAAMAIGRDQVVTWDHPSNPSGRLQRQKAKMARYLRHDAIGAELLEQGSSEAFTVSWARDHHLPEQRWTVDARIGGYLKEADGD
jgi:hypothetical protein